MSWEHSKYKAKCVQCGHEGYCIRSSDDWGRSQTRWEGFTNEEPDTTAVGRKRLDRRDMSAVCKCGSKNIEVGEYLGEI